jgi:hypothetical protein
LLILDRNTATYCRLNRHREARERAARERNVVRQKRGMKRMGEDTPEEKVALLKVNP